MLNAITVTFVVLASTQAMPIFYKKLAANLLDIGLQTKSVELFQTLVLPSTVKNNSQLQAKV